MAAVRGNEFVVARGEGVHLWDEAGNRYLDASASLWYCNVGHGRAEIADAVAEQLRTLETYSIFGEIANRPALDLAAKLAAHAPMDDAKVFFTTGAATRSTPRPNSRGSAGRRSGSPSGCTSSVARTATTGRWRSEP